MQNAECKIWKTWNSKCKIHKKNDPKVALEIVIGVTLLHALHGHPPPVTM